MQLLAQNIYSLLVTAECRCQADRDSRMTITKRTVGVTGTSLPSEWSCVVTNIIGESCYGKYYECHLYHWCLTVTCIICVWWIESTSCLMHCRESGNCSIVTWNNELGELCVNGGIKHLESLTICCEWNRHHGKLGIVISCFIVRRKDVPRYTRSHFTRFRYNAI
jgi:hypothetical protein